MCSVGRTVTVNVPYTVVVSHVLTRYVAYIGTFMAPCGTCTPECSRTSGGGGFAIYCAVVHHVTAHNTDSNVYSYHATM